MSDHDVEVKIGASVTDLQAGMQQGAAAVEQGAAKMGGALNGMNAPMAAVGDKFKAVMSLFTGQAAATSGAVGGSATAITGHAQTIGNALSGAVGNLQGQMGGLSKAIGFISSNFAALAAVAAGVGAFKEGINATKQFTGEAIGLSKALGISSSEGAKWEVALGSVGLSSDTVTAAVSGLARQLRTNEDELNRYGLVTRDANGNLRDTREVLIDSVKVLGNYKEGIDRTTAGQVMFRGAVGDATGLMKLNNKVFEEAAQKQKDLGLTVTQEGVDAMKAYKKSMIDVSDVMLALKKTIGDAVMPIFTKFGQWLSSVGPTAVFLLKGAVDGLAATFWYAKNGVTVLWETIMAGLFTLTEPVRAFGAAFYKAMTGDWAGAKAEVAGIGDNIASAWQSAMAKIAKSSDDTNKHVADLFMPGHDTKANTSGKNAPPPPPDKVKAKKEDPMKGWEATLLAEKTAYMEQNDMREMSLQDEAAYWQHILDTQAKGAQQIGAVKKKIAEAQFADEKRMAQQRVALQAEVLDHQQKLDLASVDAAQEADAQKLALGQETQLESLQMEQQFENQRYSIQRAAMVARLDMLSKDPTTNLVERQKILDALLQMEQKHANDITKIQNKASVEAAKPALDLNNSIRDSFKQGIAGMLQGTTTFAGAMKGLFTGILGAFSNMVAEMGAKWVMELISGHVTQVATAISNIMSTAAVGGAAAMASTAAIPIVGPELAPAAGASMYSAIAAMAPMASARNGYDIPAGVNPVTQLHEREMVLPAKQADAVRQMADGGGSGGAVHLHVHATDAKSVERLFRDNGRHIVTALREQNRNFAFKA